MERLELNFYYGQEAEQFTFYRLPKALITDPRFKDITNNAKLLYGLMLDRMSLSARSGWFDDENRVYIKYAVKSIMEDLNCSKVTAVGLLKELQGIGLIDMIQRNGLANIIYVKNFVSAEKCAGKQNRSNNYTGRKDIPQNEGETTPKTGKESKPVEINDQDTGSDIRLVENVDWSENQTAAGTDIERPPVQNVDPNNTIFNNTELIYNNHINLSAEESVSTQDQIDEMDKATAYMEIIRENIEYDIMMQDERWSDREMYEELYQIICDVVCVPRKMIRISGEEYPYSLVKSKFLKLNSQHLQYVIGCVARNTTKVGNIKAYLITALYNAPNTMSHYYTAEVNHDMYGAM